MSPVTETSKPHPMGTPRPATPKTPVVVKTHPVTPKAPAAVKVEVTGHLPRRTPEDT